MTKMIRSVFFTLALILLFGLPAHSQQTLGAINGTVKDPSGAVVQGAKVTIRNTATNLELTSTTSNDGSFTLVDLPLSNYVVTFSKTGFKTQVHS